MAKADTLARKDPLPQAGRVWLSWLKWLKRGLEILEQIEQIGHRTHAGNGSQFAEEEPPRFPIRSEERVKLRGGCDVMREIMTFFRKGR
jgi:hypothetical protein